MVREIFVSIMEQAPKLPAFAENSYAELLVREAQVTDLTIKIIKQLNEKDDDQSTSETKILQMIDSLLLSQKEKKQLLSVLNIAVDQDEQQASHTKLYQYD